MLDDRYKEGFDIVARRLHLSFVAQIVSPPPKIESPADPPLATGPELRFFVFEMKTGGWFASEKGAVRMSSSLYPGPKLKGGSLQYPDGIDLIRRPKVFDPAHPITQISPDGSFVSANKVNSFVGSLIPGVNPVRWGDIDMIRINFHLTGESRISFCHIKVTGIDVNGLPVVLYDEPYEDLTLTEDGDINLPTKRPQPTLSPVRPVAEIEEDAKFLEFQEHLLNNRAHYERVLRLGSTEVQRAFELAKVGVGNGASLLEKVENRPLEVLGDYVAYPCVDGVWSDLIMNSVEALNLPEIPPVERLITLPTRGVFSEAKLGHCNASEEIDNTRFWKWEEHPIPHIAPDIAAIDAGKHTVNDPDLKSTPFPQSLVNIVNPPNAPDPTGLANAMNVLAASNIFRDMSGRAEVADLLKKLSDNSVAITGVAQNAATGGAGKSTGGTNTGNAGSGTNVPTSSGSGTKSLGSSGSGTTTHPAGIPQTVAEVNDLAAGIRNHLPPAQATPMIDQLYQNAVDKTASDALGGLITDPSQLSGSFMLTNTGAPFPTGPDHQCFPVSMFQTPNFASGFGTIAERMIENDYCDTFPCSAAITYKDDNNPTEYRQFLVNHNPSLTTDTVLAAKLSTWFKAGVMRPDIMCDDGIRKDWYEIKPLSPSGAVAGVGKAIVIVAFLSNLKLPYVPGITYSPSKDIPIMSGTILGCNIGVSLNVQRFVPGIITYTLCLTGEVHKLALKATMAAILAYIATMLLTMEIGVLAIA